MINIINLDRSQEWDKIVKSFIEYDIYYLSGYTKAFYLHGDGEPCLLYYKNEDLRAMYVYMKRIISQNLYDATTPYGYGGVLFEGNTSSEKIHVFYEEFVLAMKKQNIIDNFVRYHPILRNANLMKDWGHVLSLGKTIAIDLTSEEIIYNNINPKCKNKIRKASKNGVHILHGKGIALFDEFMNIYNATMDKDNADSYYYFKRDFFKSIHQDLNENYEMFYAVYNGTLIAMSIFLFANGQMHYHLSGSLPQFSYLAPTNLLLYKAALWGVKQGFKTLHLGGGLGSNEDNLYKFKLGFNKYSNYTFSIGKEIYNEKIYDQLVRDRKMKDNAFDLNSSFFPLYRS